MFRKTRSTLVTAFVTAALAAGCNGGDASQGDSPIADDPAVDLGDVANPDGPRDEQPPAEDERPEEDPQPEPDERPSDGADTCGDGVVAAEELCDGQDTGGLTCRHLGFADGQLMCNSSCTDVRSSGCSPLEPTPIAALGATVAVGGTFDTSDPTWARPDSSCLAAGEGAHAFDAFAFVNSTGAEQRVDVTASWGEGNDGFLHAFAFGSDLRELTGCQSGNDDHEGTTSSQLSQLVLPAGGQIVVVASTYEADATFGPYDLVVATVEARPGDDPVVDPIVDDPIVDDPIAEDPGDDPIIEPPVTGDPLDAEPVAIALPGAHIDLDGNLTVLDATFVRPAEDCAGGTTEVSYELIRIVNDTGADQVVDATAVFTDGGDGVLHVFTDGFDPATPTATCLVGNDDAGDISLSTLGAIPIAAGEVLTLVVSSFSAAAGAYTLDVVTVASSSPSPAAPVGGIGTAIQLSGDLKDAAVWDRVGQDCDVTANGGQRFVAHRIVNDSNDHQHVSFTASWDGDGFLAVFTEDFLAGSPSASCVAADDDHSLNDLPGSGVFGSHVPSMRIEEGEVLVVVASSFSAMSPVGSYSIDVTTEAHSGPTVLELATDLGTKTTMGVVSTTSPTLGDGASTFFYDPVLVQNHGDHEHGIELNASWADGADGVLDVYLLDPTAPDGLGLLLASNDDFEGIENSRITSEELRVFGDEIIVVVATTFFAGDTIPSYTLGVTTTD
jgi:hypothetical protein